MHMDFPGFEPTGVYLLNASRVLKKLPDENENANELVTDTLTEFLKKQRESGQPAYNGNRKRKRLNVAPGKSITAMDSESEEKPNINLPLTEDSDTESNISARSELLPEYMEVTDEAIKPGQYALIKFEDTGKRKTIFYRYVCLIEEISLSNDITVKGMKSRFEPTGVYLLNASRVLKKLPDENENANELVTDTLTEFLKKQRESGQPAYNGNRKRKRLNVAPGKSITAMDSESEEKPNINLPLTEDSDTESNISARLPSAELQKTIEQSSDVESVVASDEDEYVPQLSDSECEESDIENDPVVEQDDSESEVEQEEPTQTLWAGKDGVTHHQHKDNQSLFGNNNLPNSGYYTMLNMGYPVLGDKCYNM
ncbi:hypothetical protein RN001_003503 [Aquatica leii]|uniref:Uncharacterized protein n=1 Tax=Aquatica leii TaxID=1421715 RepID=A0AAN7PIF2_9COLE|nr:hypothetical protein RN001_003503 [Aquatica leii]